MFLLARITGQGTPIDVPGVRGWMAPTSEAYLSRIGLTELRDADCRVRAVRARFEKEGKGLTWVVSGADRDARIPELLLSRGFRPARFAQIAGMHLQAPYPLLAAAPGLRVEEMPGDQIEGHMDIIAHAIGMTRDLARRVYRVDPGERELRYRHYLAYLTDAAQPVGYGSLVQMDGNRAALLRGSAVVPEHRGRGLYRALVQRRLADAQREGIPTALIHSARETSYPICLRMGFREACAIELYEWSPLG